MSDERAGFLERLGAWLGSRVAIIFILCNCSHGSAGQCQRALHHANPGSAGLVFRLSRRDE